MIGNIVTGLLVTVPTLTFPCESTRVNISDIHEMPRIHHQSRESVEIASTRCSVQIDIGVRSTRVSKIDLTDLDEPELNDVSFGHLYSDKTTIQVEVQRIERATFRLSL